LSVLGIAGSSYAQAFNEEARKGLLEKETTIASLKLLKAPAPVLRRAGVPVIQTHANMKMTLDGADEVTLTSRTMIYMLTKDNTEAFAKKDKETRLNEVYNRAIRFQELASWHELALERQRKGESLSGPQQAGLEAALKGEDERHRIFGPSVKLVKGMEIYLYSDKEGIAYAVLVKYTDKAAQNKTKEGKTK